MITKAQRDVLRLLADGHKGGQTIPLTPYIIKVNDFATGNMSVKTLPLRTRDPLIRMGYIEERGGDRDWYHRIYITDAGRRALEQQS